MAQLGRGVTIAQLAKLLGTRKHTRAICSSVRINKWSEKKPIHYSSSGPLTNIQFKGMSTELSQGIIYGLKAGVQNASPANIHATNWDYVGRPQGVVPSSPDRIDDFWGYEVGIENPSLYGGGLVNGQEGIYTNNENITTQITWDNRPGIINIGDVFAWGNTNAIDPSNMYLCVLIGNFARAMLAKDAGNIVAPLYYNNVENKTFCFPPLEELFTTYGLPTETELDVTIFIVHKNDINQFRDEWYDMQLTPLLSHNLVTLPFQAGLKMKFRAAGKIYIRDYNVVEETQKQSRVLVSTWSTGPDWEAGHSYRILFNVTGTGEGISSYSIPVAKIDLEGNIPTSATAFLADIMSDFPTNITQSIYTIRADFQAQASEGADWRTAGLTKTIQVLW